MELMAEDHPLISPPTGEDKYFPKGSQVCISVSTTDINEFSDCILLN
jgi:hypothetical protein